MSWEYFENRRAVDRERNTQPQDNLPSATEMARLCALTFSSPAGREMLALLRAEVIERRIGREASEASLRFMEAQRQLVLQLEHMRDVGLAAMKRESEGAKKPAA